MNSGDQEGELVEVSMVTEVIGEPQKETVSSEMTSTVEIAMATDSEDGSSAKVPQQERYYITAAMLVTLVCWIIKHRIHVIIDYGFLQYECASRGYGRSKWGWRHRDGGIRHKPSSRRRGGFRGQH